VTMTRSDHHLSAVLVILIVSSSSSGQLREGRGLWDQFPDSDSDKQSGDSDMHGDRYGDSDRHSDRDGDSQYRDSYGHQALSRRQGVASVGYSDGGHQDRSRTGGGFWGQMANSNEERTEINVERRQKPKVQIMPRTKSDSANSLEKSSIKRVNSANINMTPKKRKRKFRNTATMQDKQDAYKAEYEDSYYEDGPQKFTGEESQQERRRHKFRKG
jgi:hypothetical protein